MYYYEKIKEKLTMRDVATRYAEMPNRANFIHCPFHTEKTGSMKISENGYYCFGCGKHGNIFGFVMEMFKLDFKRACDKLNIDFGLNIQADIKLSKQDQIKALQERQLREHDKKQREMLLKYKEKQMEELEIRKERIRDKMDYIKETLYDSKGNFLSYMIEDEDFENLCSEFITLKKNCDIIDLQLVKFQLADEGRLKEIYSLAKCKFI